MPLEAYSLLYTFLVYFPAFAANGSAVLVRKGTPIDFGRKAWDGRRILGDGKTFEGLLLSLTFGVTVGVILARFLGSELVVYAFFGSFFGMLGDMCGAFIKRRLGLERGARAPVLDQLDFVVCATLGLYLVGFRVDIYGFLFVALIAFVMHVLTNRVAYRLKLKSVPW
ncbi:MAG: CDP-2,3-bis-(O-geranylgeranyl)-sn-glycerol synthase [Thermoprotei archaeon]